MFKRLELLIGKDNINKLSTKKVLIVGIGGVGGIVLEALVRSSINNITIIDNDFFEVSNLNRQILCDINSIDISKVDYAKKRMLSINKDCVISNKNIYLDKSNINELESYDYIIDTCDSIDTKLELYKYASINNVKIISSMGMGNRVDINKISITRLDRTLNDPVAKKLRYLCKIEGINAKIPVVSSTELPVISKNIGSLFTITNQAGLLIADYVIKDIINNIQ